MPPGDPETPSVRRTVRLVIPGDSNALGANKRLHWRKEHKLKQQWKQNAFLSTYLSWADDEPPLQGMVRISYIIRRPRLLDPDNAMSSKALKAAVDGIVQSGLLRGDTVKLVTIGYVRQEKAKEPEVEIILEEIEDAWTPEGDTLQTERAKESPAPGKKGRVPAGDRPKGRDRSKHDQEVAGPEPLV